MIPFTNTISENINQLIPQQVKSSTKNKISTLQFMPKRKDTVNHKTVILFSSSQTINKNHFLQNLTRNKNKNRNLIPRYLKIRAALT